MGYKNFSSSSVVLYLVCCSSALKQVVVVLLNDSDLKPGLSNQLKTVWFLVIEEGV